ncbi:MAG: cation transporter [Niabella sp.]
MKTLQLLLLISFFTTNTNHLFAQTQKTDTFSVNGECGMCKKKIETAAKAAGATFADWNKDSKKLTVKYQGANTDLSKIQQKIADAGYDNEGVAATDEAYHRLDECCQYERKAKTAGAQIKANSCCDSKTRQACCDKSPVSDCCKKS